MPRSPNILLVFADQWTFWALGHRGNRDVRTPRLDAFASQGVDVHTAVSATPVCTPARASLITGLRPDTHGLFINDVPLNPDLPSLGKHFAAVGYDTAWVGKWHVDGHGRRTYIPPERRHGFAYFKALECTHNYNQSPYYAGNDPEQKIWPGYDAFAQTDDLIGWLGERPRDNPFLAVLSWGPPHNPYDTAPAEFRAHYSPATLGVRGNVPANFTPNWDAETRQHLAGYYAHCEALDAAFGRLLDALDRLDHTRDTLVVFTSDHGDMLHSQGLSEKANPWEESLRISMLFRGPGLPAGTRNDTILEFMDLWPTLAGLAGHPVTHPLHGRDLSHALRTGTTPAENAAYYASYARHGTWLNQDRRSTPLHRCREARGLRTETHLYVESLEGCWLLYDVVNDPLQLENLADSPAHANLRAELAVRLRARRALYQDEFLTDAEYRRRWGYPPEPAPPPPSTTPWQG